MLLAKRGKADAANLWLRVSSRARDFIQLPAHQVGETGPFYHWDFASKSLWQGHGFIKVERVLSHQFRVFQKICLKTPV